MKGNHKIDEDQNARFDNIIHHREEEDKSEQDLIENGIESNSILSGLQKTIDPENNQAKKVGKRTKNANLARKLLHAKMIDKLHRTMSLVKCTLSI